MSFCYCHLSCNCSCPFIGVTVSFRCDDVVSTVTVGSRYKYPDNYPDSIVSISESCSFYVYVVSVSYGGTVELQWLEH